MPRRAGAPAEGSQDSHIAVSHNVPMRRMMSVAVFVLAGVAVLCLSWPQSLGTQRLIGIAQLIAFRALLGISLGGLALLVGTAAVLLSRRTSGRKPVLVLGLAAILALSAVLNGGVLLARGTSSDPLSNGDLVVMTWNAQGGATSPAEIARVAAESHADVVSLPETDEEAAAEIARLLAEQGTAMNAHTVRAEGEYDWIPTSALIADELGEYEIDPSAGNTPGLPSGVWRRTNGTGPKTIVAAHPLPPLPESMGGWEAGLRWIADVCCSADTVVAGDLNATVDHMTGLGVDGHLIGGCDDAALEAGGAAAGTWPSDAPWWISSPIDHVLFGSSWTAKSVRVLDGDPRGTDHRPIVAVLDRR